MDNVISVQCSKNVLSSSARLGEEKMLIVESEVLRTHVM